MRQHSGMPLRRIVYLSTRRHQYTVKRWFDPPPGPDDPELIPVAYERLDRLTGPQPPATYVFTDTDRLDGNTMRAAVALAARAKAAGHRVANWPNRLMNRVELLTTLRLRGVNGFACRRFTARGEPVRYPVFLRIDGTHDGAATPLLEDQAAMRRAVSKLLADGARRDDILIVEYQETDRFEGNFVKYAAYGAFGRVFTTNVTVSTDWTAKGAYRIYSEAIHAFELSWAKSNPHAEAVAAVFRHAGVDWGRIDYGVHNGRIQVFEINTNPDFGSRRSWSHAERRERYLIPVQLPHLRAALRHLAEPTPDSTEQRQQATASA
jgi:hypothetical protein